MKMFSESRPRQCSRIRPVLLMASALPLVAFGCSDARMEQTDDSGHRQLREMGTPTCPVESENCGGPVDPPAPTPTRTRYYPAQGWNVLTASEANAQRGVEWWAYQWSGNQLMVKGYYPQDFEGGVYDDPAHVFLTITVSAATAWTARGTLKVPMDANRVSFNRETGFVDSSISDDGIVSLYIQGPPVVYGAGDVGVIVHDLNEGIYQDDGRGPVLSWGADVLQRSAVQAIFSFLGDFQMGGGVLLPPAAAVPASPCIDEACSNSGILKYFERRQAYAALSHIPDTCWAFGITASACGGAALALAIFGPLGWFGWANWGEICGPALVTTGGACLGSNLGDRAPKGVCVTTTGPITVIRPDGTVDQTGHVVVDASACDF
jgi:hypothetical protein